MSGPCQDPIEEQQNELALELLKNFTFITFQALLDVTGPIQTRELSRKYFQNHGEAGALTMQRRLGAPSDISGANLMGKLVLLWQRRDFKKITHPDFYYWENSRCLFERAPPEFCLLWENVVNPSANQAICPDYDCVCDRMVTQGDQVCSGRVFLKPGNPYYGRMDEIPILDLPPISKEEADFWTIQVLGEEWVFCTKALLDCDQPKKALDLLFQRLEEYGRKITPQLTALFEVQGHDSKAIGNLLDGLNHLLHQVGTVNISSPQYWEKEIIECPFCNAPKEMCRQFGAFIKGVCDSIDPGFEMVHSLAMCTGDERCVWVVRRKAKDLRV